MPNHRSRSGKFLVSGVSSDAHTWNLVFLQLMLEERGHEVVNLGACVPDEVIVERCLEVRPDVLVISTVNGHGHLDGLRLVRALRARPDLAGLRVVIGGKLGVRGGAESHGEALVAAGYDAVFESEDGLEEFGDFLRELRPRRRAPVGSAA
ncbi:cobalamin B12-binding domain-containing protein [Streptomyces sp. NPDC091268]|uniref:cobalamin B12-binding domain-containing protein n=1 Tax=Streptomyces sp. NPDC091268 TaxID=3365979 RepID=UPI003830C0D5